MRRSKIILFILFLLLLTSAAITYYSINNRIQKKGTALSNPPKAAKPVVTVTVVLIPLGNRAAEAMAVDVYTKIKNVIPSIRIAKPAALPAAAYYPARNRYRADSLIAWMSRMAGKNETWLGITVSDISATHRGKDDWGVMGLGYHPGNACVASSYRMKDKTHFWKVAIHELGHTAGLPHCPVKTCFMRDAEKKNPTAEEKEFCKDCGEKLKGAGWRL